MSDNTELLISKLVAAHRATRPFAIAPILSLSIVLLAICALLLLLPLGLRADWHAAAMLKSTALLALTAVFLIAAVINSGPAAVHWRQIVLFSTAMLMTVVLFIAFANLDAELSLKQAIVDPSFWACVSWVALVGSGAVLVLHRLLRRARPAQRQIFRLAVPLCAALLAATVYSLHCPVDALAYLSSAYLLAIALVVGFSLLLSRRLWRW